MTLRTFLTPLLAVIALSSYLVQAFADDDPPLSPGPVPGPSPTPTPTPPPQFPNWSIELWNGDDSIHVKCNGADMIPVAGYNQRVTVSLNSCIHVGPDNHFSIWVYNAAGGWTYAFRVLRNGAQATTYDGKPAEGMCGQAGRVGCNNNNAAKGWVFHKGYRLERFPGQ